MRMRMRIRIRDPGIFLILDPGIFLTLDPGSGMKKFGSVIRDKHPGSTTLVRAILYQGVAC